MDSLLWLPWRYHESVYLITQGLEAVMGLGFETLVQIDYIGLWLQCVVTIKEQGTSLGE